MSSWAFPGKETVGLRCDSVSLPLISELGLRNYLFLWRGVDDQHGNMLRNPVRVGDEMTTLCRNP